MSGVETPGSASANGPENHQTAEPSTPADSTNAMIGSGTPNLAAGGANGPDDVPVNRLSSGRPCPIFALNYFGAGAGAGGWLTNDVYLRTLADVNGNGRADIVGFANHGVHVAFGNGDGTFGPERFTGLNDFGTYNGWSSNDLYPRVVADVNGNGRADIVGFKDDGVYVALGNGDGTFAPARLVLKEFGTNAGGWTSNDLYPRMLADVNGDGRADIVGFKDDGVYVAPGTASGEFCPETDLQTSETNGNTMQDLFRFLMLRPAQTVKSEDIKVLTATYALSQNLQVAPGPVAQGSAAKLDAHHFIDGDTYVRNGEDLRYGAAAFDLAARLAQGPVGAADIEAMVKAATGKTCAAATSDEAFGTEEARITNTLVAMKLLSNSFRGDAPGLARIAQGYDAIRLVAEGRRLVNLRTLTVADASAGKSLESAPSDLGNDGSGAVLSDGAPQAAEKTSDEDNPALPSNAGSLIGNALANVSADDLVGDPADKTLPTKRSVIRPVGVGDLLVVKAHVLRYEGGDLAHVENVLKSESVSRETRRLERTETTVLQETETTKEEARDTQTTDRFSLKREIADTIKSDASLKTGLSVSGKYGPFQEVKANAEFASSVATESSTKQASEFSRDVVARSASKLVERVLERRSTTTLNEFEEKYAHHFNNSAGTDHISGFYQWVDKVMEAQVYNYGKRMLFDMVLPEPATNFILSQIISKNVMQSLLKPEPFTLSASEITEGNYIAWAKKYNALDIEPLLPYTKMVDKAYDLVNSTKPYESSKSDTITIPIDYAADWAWITTAYHLDSDGDAFDVIIGSNSYTFTNKTARSFSNNLHGEVGFVPFSYRAYGLRSFALTVRISCKRTSHAEDVWKIKTHAAITQAYLAKQQAYEQALAEAEAVAVAVAVASGRVAGRNPIFNAKVVADELRKQCITLMTAQHFGTFGALELSEKKEYAQPHLDHTAEQMPYVRFFEQAFEWEHIMHFFYPYFWGWKKGWKHRLLLDDVDPDFGDFLRAGAVRVVFPVRPGFDEAVVHYLETGQIWNGGPPPNISGSLYLPITREIQEAAGAPGSEVPKGLPWEVRLPTTLVRLRPTNDLPAWKKVDGAWQEAN